MAIFNDATDVDDAGSVCLLVKVFAPRIAAVPVTCDAVIVPLILTAVPDVVA